jgi:hypothetical protein
MSQQGSTVEATTHEMQAQPTNEHDWLRKLVGEWTYEMDTAEPGKPSQKVTGTESVRAIGKLWIQAEANGEMPGAGPATSITTLGYDPEKKRFTGTWIGSMMTHMWLYDGELDPTGKVLTLNSEGPSMANDGTMSDYQDVIEVKGPDVRTLTARVKGADGSWQPFMAMTFRRRS